jgi:electron-transferring-flavoprotein dehydrogenase
MNELFPEKSTAHPDLPADAQWPHAFRQHTGSYATPVLQDQFSVLYNDQKSFDVPHWLLPPQLNNHGNFIISLSQFTRYLSHLAEQDYGVEIYPGFSASEVLVQDDTVLGIATRDVGLGRATRSANFARGVEIHARHTVLAEGARGSATEWLLQHFQMRENNPQLQRAEWIGQLGHPQTYGLGLKEVWQVPKEQFQAGFVQHTIGFPLQKSIFDKNFGGSFLYHQEPDLVLVGYVVGLDYANPYLNPYREFQKWKTHPQIAAHLKNGTCISYGARVLNEGGYHAIPQRLSVPGATIIGCGAGFLNAVKIKGTHTAMKSGMLAAEVAYKALVAEKVHTEHFEYMAALKQSWIHKELYEVRNCHASFAKWGMLPGLAYTGFATHISKGKEPWTLRHVHPSDSAATQPAAQHQPIVYPPPDNVLTFDLMTNLQRSNTYHEEDQPCHLRIKEALQQVPNEESLPVYAGPEQRFCPAGVYEYVDEKLVINSQNCIHCKCCSIKMPKEYIDWTVPEGGGGPQYQVM